MPAGCLTAITYPMRSLEPASVCSSGTLEKVEKNGNKSSKVQIRSSRNCSPEVQVSSRKALATVGRRQTLRRLTISFLKILLHSDINFALERIEIRTCKDSVLISRIIEIPYLNVFDGVDVIKWFCCLTHREKFKIFCAAHTKTKRSCFVYSNHKSWRQESSQ